MELPETRYARSGDLAIAYQTVGHGPHDLVYLQAWVSDVDLVWQLPSYAEFLEQLSTFARVILFDFPGLGVSDRVASYETPIEQTLESQVDQVETVLDAVGSRSATIVGYQDSGFVAALLAATRPRRVDRLVLYGCAPTWLQTEDTPWQWPSERWDGQTERIARSWGTREYAAEYARTNAPSLDTPQSVAWLARVMRGTYGPGALARDIARWWTVDLRSILPAIRVPTLVLHRTDDAAEPIESGRYLARRIPGARFVELPGADSPPWAGDTGAVTAAIQEFVTGTRPAPPADRVLATVLFTDIVGSTALAAELGDARWKERLAAHDRVVAAAVERFRGRLVRSTGDGVQATFDGPARAVRCAHTISEGVRVLGLETRAGCHTGEIELVDDHIEGIAVHIGARVAALAGPGEVWASSTVKDLTAGAGLAFEDRGEHELKGVPDRWHLYSVVGS